MAEQEFKSPIELVEIGECGSIDEAYEQIKEQHIPPQVWGVFDDHAVRMNTRTLTAVLVYLSSPISLKECATKFRLSKTSITKTARDIQTHSHSDLQLVKKKDLKDMILSLKKHFDWEEGKHYSGFDSTNPRILKLGIIDIYTEVTSPSP